MYIYSLANANASVITVTSTATTLYSLLDTAGSAANNLPGSLNAVDLVVESGSDVRILFDGNTPTASKGILLSQGAIYSFRGVPLTQLKLIRTGSSNASVSVQVGFSKEGESSSAAAYAVTLEASSITIGEVQSSSATTTANATVACDTTAGGTSVVAANTNRAYTEFTNTGGVVCYYGTGTVTSSFQQILPSQTKAWNSQEQLKVLSSSGSVNIVYVDYINS